MVLWTDGSRLDTGNVGAAVIWRDKSLNKWRETSLFLGENKKILDAELWAISIALEAAKRETGGNFSAPITVFTNSREALATSQQSFPRTGSPYLRGLIYISEGLRSQKKRRSVTIGWIPGHVGLVGHDRADQSAKARARRGGMPTEQWSSPHTYPEKRLIESRFSELARWHEAKRDEREASRRGFYIPRLKTGMG